MPKIILIASFKPSPGKKAGVEKILRDMLAPTRAEEGCEKYDLYKDEDGSGYHLMEVYNGQDAVTKHRNSEHYKNYRAMIADQLERPPAVRTLLGVDVKEG